MIYAGKSKKRGFSLMSNREKKFQPIFQILHIKSAWFLLELAMALVTTIGLRFLQVCLLIHFSFSWRQNFAILLHHRSSDHTANVLSAEFTDECLRTKSKDNYTHTCKNLSPMVVTRAIANSSKNHALLMCRIWKMGWKIFSSLDFRENPLFVLFPA